MHVKAVVVERAKEVSYGEVDDPCCGSEDIQVATGALTDPRWVRFPCIPGHEWSGYVVEVGERVTDLAPGDRVVCEGMIPCLRCVRCKAGETNLCRNYDQLGCTRGGGYGEYVLAP